jgi:hypothetical protein
MTNDFELWHPAQEIFPLITNNKVNINDMDYFNAIHEVLPYIVKVETTPEPPVNRRRIFLIS